MNDFYIILIKFTCDIDIIFDLSLLQYKYLLALANENNYLLYIAYPDNTSDNNILNNENTDILIRVPYSF